MGSRKLLTTQQPGTKSNARRRDRGQERSFQGVPPIVYFFQIDSKSRFVTTSNIDEARCVTS